MFSKVVVGSYKNTSYFESLPAFEVFTVVISNIVLMTNYVKHVYMCLVAIYIYFSKVSVQISCPFIMNLLFCYYWVLRIFIYIHTRKTKRKYTYLFFFFFFWIKVLGYNNNLETFSPVFASMIFIVPFTEQENLNFMKSNLLIYYFTKIIIF